MTMTTQDSALTTIRAFLNNLAASYHLLADHVSDIRRGVSSTRKAMQLRDLSDAELNELGITRDTIVEYTFRDEI